MLFEDREMTAPKKLELDKLNPEQKEAVTYGEGPLLILAGAGSGKTRVITHRIAWLVEQGVHPAEILAITFTNKAAAEMKDRLSELLGPVAQRMWVGTFHGMMLRILRVRAEALGFSPSFTILDVDDQQNLIKRVMVAQNLDPKILNPRELQHKISSAKNKLMTPEDVLKSADTYPFLQELADVYAGYQKQLKEQNSMDFDDILMHSVTLFEDFPAVLEYYQRRFRHVLVDEYQDTNHAQYRLVALLSQLHRNLCVVGDDDQSIYRFRGANLQNILDFEKDFKGCKVIKLEQNYRSTSSILDAANAVISQNVGRKKKRLWTENDSGEPLTFYRAGDQYDEARWIAKEIRQAREEGLSASEIAILYRVNALSRNVEFALREQGIPYRVFSGLRFYDRKEIRDCLAYMRLIDSPEDALALARVINTPRRGIGDVTVERVRQIMAEEGKTAAEVLDRAAFYPELQRAATNLKGFSDLIEEMREIRDKNELTFAQFVETVQVKSGLLAELTEQMNKGELEAESRLENLYELRSDALEFEAHLREELRQLEEMSEQYGDSPYASELFDEQQGEKDSELSLKELNRAFLERASLYSDSDQADDQEAVSLMTIHSAKGLEFDLVFIAGAEEEIFPGRRSLYDPEELEEERRLAYVAITRARRKLNVSATRSRLLYGKTSYGQVSRFIEEIPDELIEEIGGSRHGDGEFFTGRERQEVQERNRSRVGGEPSFFGKKKENPFATPQRKTTMRSNSEDKKERLLQLEKGATLRHPRFGLGTLLKTAPVSGDAILTIDFEGKIKHMMAGMAELTIED